MAQINEVAAAKLVTASIPIVFPVAVDPVGSGVVASLSRPGGNVTGLSLQGPEVAGKRIELLRAIVPAMRQLVVLANEKEVTCYHPREGACGNPSPDSRWNVCCRHSRGRNEGIRHRWRVRWPVYD
jgi:ABC transporter substrate binding protein